MRLIRDRRHGWLVETSFEEREAIKSLGARWLPELKLWRLGMSYDMLSRLSTGDTPIQVPAAEMALIGDMLATTYDQVKLDESIFKIPPFAHQRPALKFLILKESGPLYMDMGTGKTFVAISYMFHRFLENKIKRCLIVSPLSLFDHWVKEIKKYAPTEDYKITVLDCAKNERISLLRPEFMDPEKLSIYVTNYESLSGRAKKSKDGEDAPAEADPVLSAYKNAGFQMVVCDEAHKIKNWKAKQSQAVKEIARTSLYRVALTGTPVTNKINDLYSQYEFIDTTWFGDNPHRFDNRYNIYEKKETRSGQSFKVLVGHKNQGEIEKILASSSFRVKKSDCLDLPPQVFQVRTVEMTKDQKAAHQDVKNILMEVVSKAGSPMEVQNALVRTVRQRQITSGYHVQEDGSIKHFEPNPKLAEFMDIVDQIGGQKRFVVWTSFLEDVHMIKATLDSFDLRSRAIYGDVPREERTQIINALKDGKLDAIAFQIQTGGLGIDLSFLDTSIFYSNTYNFADRDQALSRTHRHGSEGHESVTYIDIVCKGSIDRLVMNAFQKKKNLSDYIFENRQKIMSGTFDEELD